MWPSNNIVANFLKQTTSNYFTKSNLSVTESQRHRHLSEEIFYDSLGIGIQIRRGAKSAHRYMSADLAPNIRHHHSRGDRIK